MSRPEWPAARASTNSGNSRTRNGVGVLSSVGAVSSLLSPPTSAARSKGGSNAYRSPLRRSRCASIFRRRHRITSAPRTHFDLCRRGRHRFKRRPAGRDPCSRVSERARRSPRMDVHQNLRGTLPVPSSLMFSVLDNHLESGLITLDPTLGFRLELTPEDRDLIAAASMPQGGAVAAPRAPRR